MALVGLSLLIASVSYLFWRHPPTSWSFLPWLQQTLTKNGAPATIASSGDAAESRGIPTVMAELVELPAELGKSQQDDSKAMLPLVTKDVDDRISMPPPPPKRQKVAEDRKAMPPPSFKSSRQSATSNSNPASPTTPRASVPSFTLSNDNPPALPSLNSAQRGRGPPSFSLSDPDLDLPPSFPAANSAQRASGDINGPPRLKPISVSPSLMAPPQRSSLPNRGPPSASPSSSLFPPPTHTSIPSKPRKKVLLTPGHSPLDWARLASSPSTNLTGLPPNTPFLRVPPSLLKQFTGRKGKDAWTVLGGKVYNITPYLPYHPGGEPELLRCAGRDGTKLFGEVHPWVNWEGMLEGCLVGLAVEEGEVKVCNQLEEMD